MPSTRKSKPSCVRPAWRSTSDIKRRPSSLTGAPAKSTIRLPLRQGRQPPWNLCDVPLSGWCCNQSRGTVRRLMQPGGPGGGVSPAPRPTTTVPAADLAGRPDLIERNFTADAPVPETGGRPSPICFSPGKDSCTRQAVTGLLLEKNCWLRHSRETCEPTCLQNALQNWRFGTASPSRRLIHGV